MECFTRLLLNAGSTCFKRSTHRNSRQLRCLVDNPVVFLFHDSMTMSFGSWGLG